MEKNPASASAQMLIRKSASEVFQAFIDPEVTKHFWFSKGSAPLEVNKEVEWTWEMYGFSAKVIATEIIAGECIQFDWYGSEKPTMVRIDFKTLNPTATYVSIVHSGFDQTGEDLVETLKDSTGGFTLVLAGLKAYLEHGIRLNLVGDKYPAELRDLEGK